MSLTRSSLPSEFSDVSSKQMLIQPQPNYLYARMKYAAYAQAQLQKSGMRGQFGINPQRAAPSGGAPVPDLTDFELLLGDPVAGGALKVSLELEGTGVEGDTVKMPRPVFSGGGYTIAARTINPSADISTTPVNFKTEQSTMTLKLVGGPSNAAGTGVAPMAIDVVAAKRSGHSIEEYVGLQFQYDRTVFDDTVIANLFTQGSVTLYPQNPNNATLTADTAFLTAGDRAMDLETILRVGEQLATLKVPMFPNGRWMMIVTPRQKRQLESDPEFQRLTVFDQSRNPLAQGFMKTVNNVDVYYSNTNPTATNSGSITYQKACAFGPGAIGYAPGEGCIVRASTADNFGLSPKCIWTAVEAIEVLDNRFIVNVFSD